MWLLNGNCYYTHDVCTLGPLDVLWGQPIKLAQVASTSELLEFNEMAFFSLKLFPVISAGPQKYKHKIGHN